MGNAMGLRARRRGSGSVAARGFGRPLGRKHTQEMGFQPSLLPASSEVCCASGFLLAWLQRGSQSAWARGGRLLLIHGAFGSQGERTRYSDRSRPRTGCWNANVIQIFRVSDCLLSLWRKRCALLIQRISLTGFMAVPNFPSCSQDVNKRRSCFVFPAIFASWCADGCAGKKPKILSCLFSVLAWLHPVAADASWRGNYSSQAWHCRHNWED